MRTCGKAYVVTALLAGLLLGAAGPAQEVRADLVDLSVEQIQQDLETFQAFHRWQLDAAQVQALAAAVKPVDGLVAQLRERIQSPLVRQAMLQLRAAWAAGKEPDPLLFEQLEQARRQAQQPGPNGITEDRVWQAARTAAAGFAKTLRPEQMPAVAFPEVAEQAEWLYQQMREARNGTPAEWAQWRDERVKDITGDRNDDKEQVSAALRQALDFARGLTPDEYFTKRPEVVSKVRAALYPPVDAARLAEVVQQRMAERMLRQQRFNACVQELAASLAAAPQ